ncbi:MAG: class I SAM-dependent methyltransferase [Vicinamibacterales bacterium]
MNDIPGPSRLARAAALGFDATRLGHIVHARRALPGAGYTEVLAWVHRALRPATYVEIGVFNGDSLVAAQPGTRIIGIDPAPTPNQPLPAGTRLFTMTSDEFFAGRDLPTELGAGHFDLAFIDGLHLFEQALLDFVHLERFAGPRSVIVLHDCLPLDSDTSQRVRTTDFYSGDVWKLTLCLRQERPDLTMTIIPTPPTGLCLVSGLDARSTALDCAYEACVARYVGLTFEDYRASANKMPAHIVNREAVVMAHVTALREGNGQPRLGAGGQ